MYALSPAQSGQAITDIIVMKADGVDGQQDDPGEDCDGAEEDNEEPEEA